MNIIERLRSRVHDSHMDAEWMMDEAANELEAQEARIVDLEMAQQIDGGTALALYIELAAYLDPKLTEHDKSIVLSKIKSRVSASKAPSIK